ncbi:hypothetical protein BDY21DRAFT_163650 [Lineolata rhizophorae]|uniref:Uncharacterized protein n=1 Tax=Lineolata rhizophorae TaxID=578093 RepID=A0A6A6PAC8_9PEZI|nr:hypothetical protein BDY21DRAFT_163650 [Lineolata rhizophorae]
MKRGRPGGVRIAWEMGFFPLAVFIFLPLFGTFRDSGDAAGDAGDAARARREGMRRSGSVECGVWGAECGAITGEEGSLGRVGMERRGVMMGLEGSWRRGGSMGAVWCGVVWFGVGNGVARVEGRTDSGWGECGQRWCW